MKIRKLQLEKNRIGNWKSKSCKPTGEVFHKLDISIMAAMKSMMVYALHSGSTMMEKIDNSTKLSLGQSVVNTFTLQRMIASKTVEFGLIKYGGDPDHFASEVVSLQKPTLDFLQQTLEVQPSSGQGSIDEAVILAHTTLMETNQNKKYNRILLIITDGQEVDSISQNTMQLLRNDDCIVYVLLLCTVDELHNNSTINNSIMELSSFASSVNGYFSVAHNLIGCMTFLSGGPGLGKYN